MPLLIGTENQRLVKGIDAINSPSETVNEKAVEDVVENMSVDPEEFNKTEEVVGKPVGVKKTPEPGADPQEAEAAKPKKSSKSRKSTKK